MSKRIIGLGVLLCILIVVMPMALIFSLNTLFGLSIAITPKTWLAALILSAFFSTNRKT